MILLYNIDDRMSFMWRLDNRHILAPGLYRMNLKYLHISLMKQPLPAYMRMKTLL